MSTSTLSERLRAFKSIGYFTDEENIELDQCIAMAEAREPKVMTDEEINKAASAYMAKGWDEEPPHDHPAKDAAYTEIAFRDGLRYAIDHGHLSPKVMPTYLSRDYNALYDLLCKGGEAMGYVDMKWPHDGSITRDVCKVVRFKEWDIDMLARGVGYGNVRKWEHRPTNGMSEREALIHECQRLNLEFLAPLDRSRMIEAGNAMYDALRRYEMDVDEDPPYKHRAMMEAWESSKK